MDLKTTTRKYFKAHLPPLTEESKPETFLTCAKNNPLMVAERWNPGIHLTEIKTRVLMSPGKAAWKIPPIDFVIGDIAHRQVH